MIQSISGQNADTQVTAPQRNDDHRAQRGHRAHRPEISATHVESTNSRSGSLEVTTAEGDKVSISFSAVDQFQADQAQVRTRGGRATSQSVAQSSQTQVQVKVEGSLNDQEVQDISNLLQALSSAAKGEGTSQTASNSTPPASNPTPASAQDPAYQTISAFQFQYQEHTEVKYGQVYFG